MSRPRYEDVIRHELHPLVEAMKAQDGALRNGEPRKLNRIQRRLESYLGRVSYGRSSISLRPLPKSATWREALLRGVTLGHRASDLSPVLDLGEIVTMFGPPSVVEKPMSRRRALADRELIRAYPAPVAEVFLEAWKINTAHLFEDQPSP